MSSAYIWTFDVGANFWEIVYVQAQENWAKNASLQNFNSNFVKTRFRIIKYKAMFVDLVSMTETKTKSAMTNEKRRGLK